MLISFSVSNFRSFGVEQTLNMVASKKLTDHSTHLVSIPGTNKDILRSAVIYGANAAGKSNLVNAMAFAQRIITGEVRQPAAVHRHRFRHAATMMQTTFEFRFLTSGRVFIYGFDVDTQGISNEWLSVLTGESEKVLFERDADGQSKVGTKVACEFPDDTTLETTLKALSSLPLTPRQLLVHRASTLPEKSQGATLRSVIKWLTKDLVILHPDHRASDILDRLASDSQFQQLVECFLKSVGTGVDGLAFHERELEVSDPEKWFLPPKSTRTSASTSRRSFRSMRGSSDELSDIRPKPDEPAKLLARTLLASHLVNGVSSEFPFVEESDGTKQLLHLMPVLASATNETRVVVIDELDRSLHPLLCWEFIRLFSESAPGAHKQLIVTTHEAHLLNQKLLRRDEYWFVEKDAEQQSRLVSLSDFNVRNDLQIEKSYLQGRFGAVPFIGSLEELQSLIGSDATPDESHAS